MSPCSSRGCRFWKKWTSQPAQVREAERRNPNRCKRGEKKSSQNSGVDIRKPLSAQIIFWTSKSCDQADRFSSPPTCVIQSRVYSRSSALNCLRKSFSLFFPPYSLFSPCSSLVSTHTNSEPPTLSLELRLWCQQQRELQEVVTLSGASHKAAASNQRATPPSRGHMG